jgi:hypothetical protein
LRKGTTMMANADRQTWSGIALVMGLMAPWLGGCGVDSEESPSEANDELVSLDPGEVATTAWQANGLRATLNNNPGARLISSHEVELRDGVVVDIPASPLDVQGCPKFWLCLSSDSEFNGEQIRFFNCNNEFLGNYRMTNGKAWTDQVSSIRNAQAGSNAQARFYNLDGSGSLDPSHWHLVVALNINNYLRNLMKDSSADGGNANDKIDIVHVCG